MPKISLRAYNREIEGMIDRGLTEEALAHCRHILKFYPKYIDTYRLLGKAYLESQRYAEAADILQRVLSCVPDDFISQIGMSIIREDEGNLDASIWHMERAFEVQPSNTAVQDELRRLYGRRDGIEPPKIRLTRGALVRMYARGELFQQAIAEIRAAVAENPQRIDLEIILARMYYLNGQKVTATEICSRLINKLPYCFEANRILAEILPTTSRAEDAQVYLLRIQAMDPYLAFRSSNTQTTVDVPENAVILEQLDWQPGEEIEAKPEWAKTIGVNWSEEQEEILPDWFTEIKPKENIQLEDLGSEPVEPLSVDFSQNSIDQNTDDEIPEWMREAGWTPSSGNTEEETPIFEAQMEDISTAEIPDWLKAIAPTEITETASTVEDAAIDWLNTILPDEELPDTTEKEDKETFIPTFEIPAAETASDWINPTPEEKPTLEFIEEEQTPDWLSELTLPTDEALAETPNVIENLESPDESEIPEWLKPSQSIEEPSQEISLENIEEITIPENEVTGVPEWLISTESIEGENQSQISPEIETAPEIKPAAEEELPAWLIDFETSAEQVSSITPPSELDTSDVPEWLMDSRSDQSEIENLVVEEEISAVAKEEISPETINQQPSSGELPDLNDIDATMAWLESLAANQKAVETPSSTEVVDHNEIIQNSVEIPSIVNEADVFTNQISEDQTYPDWLAEEAEETNLPLEQAAKPESSLPEWLRDSLESETESINSQVEKVKEPPKTPEFEVPANMEEVDVDAAYAWLASLAENQPQPSDSEISTETEKPITTEDIPMPRGETTPMQTEEVEIPSWLEDTHPTIITTPKGLETEENILQSVTAESEVVVSETKTPESEIPEWLSDVTIPDSDQSTKEEPADEELSEWLQSITTAETKQPTQQELVKLDAVPENNIPDWLASETEEPIPDVTEPPILEAPQTEWIREFEDKEEITSILVEQQLEAPGNQEEMPEGDSVKLLQFAQEAMTSHHIDQSLEAYNRLIQSGDCLEETIHDLRDALYRYPIDISIWQSLGDAYMRNNQLQDALDAYTKAEELLR